MADLSLRKVKKVYDNTVVAVQAFDLETQRRQKRVQRQQHRQGQQQRGVVLRQPDGVLPVGIDHAVGPHGPLAEGPDDLPQMGQAVAAGILHQVAVPQGEVVRRDVPGKAGNGVGHDDFIAGNGGGFHQAVQGGEGHEYAPVAGIRLVGGEIRLSGDDAGNHKGLAVDGHGHACQVRAAEEPPGHFLIQHHQVVHQVVALDVRAGAEAQGVEVEEIPSHADGLDGGVSAVVGANGDLGRAAVRRQGLRLQAVVFSGSERAAGGRVHRLPGGAGLRPPPAPGRRPG